MSDRRLAVPCLTVPLYRLAHARTGDKGDRSNISVIAFHDELYPLLETQLTEELVRSLLRARRPRAVTRYALPRLGALNFVIDGVLDGGVNDALNLDAHGKSLGYLLLSARIEVPVALVPRLAPESEWLPQT